MKDKPLEEIRREYGERVLTEAQAFSNPIDQFKVWLNDAIEYESLDPTAMVLATVDEANRPDIRILLLKKLYGEHFIFYTNYESAKGEQLNKNKSASILFYWAHFSRQVRIRGWVEKIPKKYSEKYFSLRPRSSQMSAVASRQSEVIPSRDILLKQVESVEGQFKNKSVPCPDYWGGYALVPEEFEFWQGRDKRLHDRMHYQKMSGGKWEINRLSP